ncbi:MAG TPA: hypothetical protein PLF31_02950 [Candidatus Paceibacterota bacterium]|nr:hypothetical protein [Candidatus Paceibacterota bacterium]
MNISLNSIFKKKKSSVKLYDHALHVYRDWAFAAGFVCIATAALAVLHAFLAYKVNSGTLFSFAPEERAVPTTVDRNRLSQAIEDVNVRAKKYGEARAGLLPIPVDPAIGS